MESRKRLTPDKTKPADDIVDLMAQAFNQLDTLAGIGDAEGRLLFANKSALKAAGTTLEAVKGVLFRESPWRNHSEEAKKLTDEMISRALGGESVLVEDSIIDRKGVDVLVIFSVSPLRNAKGKIVGFITEGKNISEIKKLQARLQRERWETRQWLDSMVSYVFRCDPDGRIIFCNAPLLQAIGMKLKDVIGLSPLDLSWRANLNGGKHRIAEAIAKARQGEKSTLEIPYKDRGGVVNTVLISVSPIVDADGKVVFLAAEAKNITKQVEMREMLLREERYHSRLLEKEVAKATSALEATEQFNKDLIESAPMGIVYLDDVGRISFANDEMKSKFALAGLSPDDICGKTLDELSIFPAGPSWNITGSFEAIPIEFRYAKVVMCYGEKEKLMFEANTAPLKSHSKGTVVIMNDVTQRSRLETELSRARMQSEKLAALGLLVSGVAHEINNPLTSIIGCAEFLSEDMNLDGKAREAAEIIVSDAKRSGEIVRNLLAFARHSVGRKAVTNINEVIRTVMRLRLAGLRDQGINVLFDLRDDMPYVEADVTQMQQVILNLVNNAAEAIRNSSTGGTITIRTTRKGESVTIVFEDDGPGIPKDILPSIFDPFFTTKNPGEGTGLGLSICYGIIEEHGGTISVDNNYPHGAIFVVKLPTSAAVEQSRKRERDIAWIPSSVLVVDDESNICRSLSHYLTGLGSCVDVAFDGQDAIDKARRKPYDMMLVDFKMPNINGLALYRELAKSDPDIANRFVFMTGAQEKELEEFLQTTNSHLLTKPFTREDILDLLSKFRQQSKISGKTGSVPT
jgi:two-component system NtrC family sensor kinase